jgi:hypothetical protein
MEAKPTLKNPNIFECKKCNFITSNKKDYNRHIMTRKHNMEAFGSMKKPQTYLCEFCNKQYRSRGSLWKHQKKCSNIPDITTKIIQDTTEFNSDIVKNTDIIHTMMHLIEQNQEFKTLLLEQQRDIVEQQQENQRLHNESQKLQNQLIEAVKDTGNTYNSTTNNNQKFNLNFFLNTTCKDAMNMSEFIENIEVNFKDIENIGKNGYVSGMTDMIVSRIKELDITKRPMHCTDLKRETMYIKDNNEWTKDTPENTKLHQMIDYMAKQNYAKMPLWRQRNPECLDSDHPKYDFCIKMMRNMLGDVGLEQKRLDNKVIKNLSKHIFVDKAVN